MRRTSPEAILNLTGFALGLWMWTSRTSLNPFAETDAPVIQLVQGGRPEAQWAADMQGSSSQRSGDADRAARTRRGRIGGIIVGHKAERPVWHAATECPLVGLCALDAGGIARAVALAANWVRLRKTPQQGERKVAIVLANYLIRDGGLANGVGYDAPASTIEILRHWRRHERHWGYPPPLKGEGGLAENLSCRPPP